MLHLVKLAPGCASLEDLEQRMRQGTIYEGLQTIYTRTQPKRAEDIAGKGSIYRVLAGFVAARQRVMRFEPYQRADGHSGTMILVEPKIIPVQPRPMKPFQGWRYYRPEDAPPDMAARDLNTLQSLPPHIRKALTELCLL